MIEIDDQKCDGCARCMDICPVAAIYLIDDRARIDLTICTECGACIEVCPNDAIQMQNHEKQEHPVAYHQSPQPSMMAAVKSSMIAVGTTLLPLVISKLGSLVVSKLENWKPASLQPDKYFSKPGRKVRRRYHGGGEK